jgi:hypothetical protein
MVHRIVPKGSAFLTSISHHHKKHTYSRASHGAVPHRKQTRHALGRAALRDSHRSEGPANACKTDVMLNAKNLWGC